MFGKNWKRIISMVLVLALLVQVTPLAVRAEETYPADLECDPQTGMSALYEYTPFDTGMAGTAYVNTYLGTLHLRRNDLSLGGERMPVAIGFYYDPVNDISSNPYGVGWSTTYNQVISYDQQGERFAYKDENGTWVYFVDSGEMDESGAEIWTEDVEYGVGAIGAELYRTATATETDYTAIELVIGEVHYGFDSIGRLINMVGGVNQITITYVGETNAIDRITDAVGRQYRFTYTSGYLSAVQCYTSDGEEISNTNIGYTITDGKLLSVTYAENEAVQYAYDASGRLAMMANLDLCGYAFGYADNTNVVTTVTSKAAMGTDEEVSGYQTVIGHAEDGEVTVTSDTSQTAYTFDGCGRVASCELRMMTDVSAQSLDGSEYQCVYGYSFTYGYVTDDDGTVTNAPVDVEVYDSEGVIEDTEEESTEEETEPTETEPDPYSYTKDSYGNILSETYTVGSLKQTNTYTYSADGNYLLSQTDENGNTVQYQYDLDSGVLAALTDANQNTTEYTYNAMRELQSVQMDVSELVNGTGMEAEYYYEHGRLKALVYGVYQYVFEYDVWGNVTQVTMNDNALVTYSYGNESYKGQVQTMTYGNGQKVYYSYDALGQVVSVGYTDQLNRFQYSYTSDGALSEIYDAILDETTVYTDSGFEIRAADDSVVYSYTADESGNSTEYINGNAVVSEVQSDNSKTITDANSNLLLFSGMGYDALDRLERKIIGTANGEIIQTYSYETDSNGNTGSYIEEYSVAYVENGTEYLLIYAYEYDGNGNITSVTETLKKAVEEEESGSGSGLINPGVTLPTIPSGEDDSVSTYVVGGEDAAGSVTYETVSEYTYIYTYDEAGQLTYARDEKAGKTYRYGYDASGNMIASIVGNITASGTESVAYRTNYTYTNGVLTGTSRTGTLVPSTSTTYQVDSMGNPVAYTTGGNTYYLNWGEGRMLTSIGTDADNNVSYTYNADGLRTSKTVKVSGESTTTQYIWGSNGLAGTVSGDTTVIVLYDVDGEPAGFSVNGTVYTYVKNIQGDVMQILDSTGDTVVSYTYDPWGVPTVTGNTTLAAINPCSYRGYDYDEETGYYYLQSRYYDPTVGRFLNADDTDLINYDGSLMTCNIFIYCNNVPINNSDPIGYGQFVIRRWMVSALIDAILALAPAVGLAFAPIKSLAKAYSKAALKSKVRTPLAKFIKAVANAASKMITGIKKVVTKYAGASVAKLIPTQKLVSFVAGLTATVTINKLLNILVNNIDIVLSVGGLVAGVLDYAMDKRLDNRIWVFTW